MGFVEGRCDARFAPVREIFEQSFASGEEIGAAIAFCLDGELVVDLWGGHCDFARTQPWQRDTIVNVYSTTKGMTALCAHQLVERGLLDLDAPVARTGRSSRRRARTTSRCAGCSLTGGIAGDPHPLAARRALRLGARSPPRSPRPSRGGSPARSTAITR
jgi:CubicO group peptidase (beta-lactamase class C family)